MCLNFYLSHRPTTPKTFNIFYDARKVLIISRKSEWLRPFNHPPPIQVSGMVKLSLVLLFISSCFLVALHRCHSRPCHAVFVCCHACVAHLFLNCEHCHVYVLTLITMNVNKNINRHRWYPRPAWRRRWQLFCYYNCHDSSYRCPVSCLRSSLSYCYFAAEAIVIHSFYSNQFQSRDEECRASNGKTA